MWRGNEEQVHGEAAAFDAFTLVLLHHLRRVAAQLEGRVLVLALQRFQLQLAVMTLTSAVLQSMRMARSIS